MSLTMPAEEEVAQHEGNIGSSIARTNGKKTNVPTSGGQSFRIQPLKNSVPLSGGP